MLVFTWNFFIVTSYLALVFKYFFFISVLFHFYFMYGRSFWIVQKQIFCLQCAVKR